MGHTMTPTQLASNLEFVLSGLTDEQCKQFTAAMVKFSTPSSSDNSNAFANVAGLFNPSIPSFNSIFSHPWILDSRATDHITSDSSCFVDKNPSNVPSVNLLTGSSVPIDYSTRTILFNTDITLTDVLHAPSFNLNLLSASKITKSLRCCIILFPDFCVL